jgi:Transposase DDE domain group 1
MTTSRSKRVMHLFKEHGVKDYAGAAAAIPVIDYGPYFDGPLRDRMAGGGGNPRRSCDLPGQWIDAVHKRRQPRVVVLDVDSSESPTYGAQEGSAYNGHFGCTCYHPLFVFNQLGDLERCALRSGNVHSAASWREVLEPVVARYRGTVKWCCFRGDAAFANPEIYEFLEAEGMGYAIRLPANRILQEKIEYLLKRPVGRPPHEVRHYYASFSYQAQRWKKPRRVAAKVEWHPGELYPRVGFIVTNLARPAERLVAFYNQRGTAELCIKEGKGVIQLARGGRMRRSASKTRLTLVQRSSYNSSSACCRYSPEGAGSFERPKVSRHSVASPRRPVGARRYADLPVSMSLLLTRILSAHHMMFRI